MPPRRKKTAASNAAAAARRLSSRTPKLETRFVPNAVEILGALNVPWTKVGGAERAMSLPALIVLDTQRPATSASSSSATSAEISSRARMERNGAIAVSRGGNKINPQARFVAIVEVKGAEPDFAKTAVLGSAKSVNIFDALDVMRNSTVRTVTAMAFGVSSAWRVVETCSV